MNLAPHLNKTITPTPITAIHHFFKDLSRYRVWLKRDDLTGLELSGNKVRKLDFLLAEARAEDAERIITCGGVHSNHCRSTAFYATQLGLKTTLVLRGTEPKIKTGNYLLNEVLDADIHLISAREYEKVDEVMAEIREAASEKAYIIPEGGSNEIGAWGYVKAFMEISEQISVHNLPIDTIAVATGSGGTHAGLLLGKLLSKSPLNVVSVNVCDDADFFVRKIGTIIERFCRRYNYHLNWQDTDIHIIDGFVGEGYGLIGPTETDLIRRFARSEGIIIDPVYGAKAMRGLEVHLKQGTFPGENILFIHTGGIFGLFSYHEQL